jgi:hypothetical protein
MPRQPHSFDALKKYLPEGSFEKVMHLIELHKVHLTISRERQTKLGDYRHGGNYQNHRISVNGNLHPYAFLITLIHELAHLVAFDQFGQRIAPHGPEWKQTYSQMLAQYIGQSIFPQDVEWELIKMMRNPAASSSAEDDLQRVLRRYEQRRTGYFTVEEIGEGMQFKMDNGRIFLRGQKVRKRIKCLDLTNQKLYLFHPLYEVKIA